VTHPILTGDCALADPHLVDLALGTPDEVPAEVRAHVDACARCRDERDGLAQVRLAWSRLPVVEPSASFDGELLDAVYGPASVQRRPARRRVASLVAALGVAATVAIAFIATHEEETATPKEEREAVVFKREPELASSASAGDASRNLRADGAALETAPAAGVSKAAEAADVADVAEAAPRRRLGRLDETRGAARNATSSASSMGGGSQAVDGVRADAVAPAAPAAPPPAPFASRPSEAPSAAVDSPVGASAPAPATRALAVREQARSWAADAEAVPSVRPSWRELESRARLEAGLGRHAAAAAAWWSLAHDSDAPTRTVQAALLEAAAAYERAGETAAALRARRELAERFPPSASPSLSSDPPAKPAGADRQTPSP
jgi:hypothetical protein